MNKVVTAMICIIIIIAAIFTALIIVNYNKNDDKQQIQTTQLAQANEQIIDECTEEYEVLQEKQTLQANSNEEKISPNCIMKLEKYYAKCGHTTNEYIELDKELINKGQAELKQKYPNWQIQKYTSTEIILAKTYQGECGQHYVIKEKDGKITINRILETGEEQQYQATDISTEYLEPQDQEKLKEGIKINSKENLNQYLENFE